MTKNNLRKKSCVITLAGKEYKLKFKSKAVAALEEVFDMGIARLFSTGKIDNMRLAIAVIYAGRLWLKDKLPRGWSADAAADLIDDHEESGGDWTDINNNVMDALMACVPGLSRAVEEELAKKEEGVSEEKEQVRAGEPDPLSVSALDA